MNRFMSGRTATAAAAFILLAACASGEAPRAELGAAQAAIEAAQRSGAAERAPVELNNARVKYDAANAAVRDEEYDRAARLAREAEIDAQLAAAKAQAEASRTAARQVREDAATLQRETAPAAPATQSPPVSITPQTRPAQ
ncbi:MAG TPA: DUF4398 domain-containing protein [Alphaproteobacteria bacterium]|nr:DUF4398 domain-containing protein [Alphaproteobacteria bacterium]